MPFAYVVKIATHIDTHLHSRDAAQIFFAELDRTTSATYLHLDFADVFYMSRSFADQFYKERQRMTTTGKTIEIFNASPQITAILATVEKTQNATNRQRPILPYIKFDNEQDFENYLLAI
jgi:anti-anti-sigma regulatory factor